MQADEAFVLPSGSEYESKHKQDTQKLAEQCYLEFYSKVVPVVSSEQVM